MLRAGAFASSVLMPARPLSLSLSKALPGLALAAILGGCSSGSAPAVAAGAEHIACALGKGAQFAPACAVDRAQQDGEKVLVVRHPDGGFRRFLVLNDGHGLAAADGAAVAQVAIADRLLEVTVEDDRYRFPFTAKARQR